jgi:hypothetical protein
MFIYIRYLSFEICVVMSGAKIMLFCGEILFEFIVVEALMTPNFKSLAKRRLTTQQICIYPRTIFTTLGCIFPSPMLTSNAILHQYPTSLRQTRTRPLGTGITCICGGNSGSSRAGNRSLNLIARILVARTW